MKLIVQSDYWFNEGLEQLRYKERIYFQDCHLQIVSLIAIIREIVEDDRAVHYIELIKVMTKLRRGSLCGNCRAHYHKIDKRRFVKRNCDIVTRQRFLFTLVEAFDLINDRAARDGKFRYRITKPMRNSTKWRVRRCVCWRLFDKQFR